MKVVTRILAIAIAGSFAFGCAEQPGKKKDDEKSKDDKKGADEKKDDKKAEVDPPKKE
jgi:hypothetical protein